MKKYINTLKVQLGCTSNTCLVLIGATFGVVFLYIWFLFYFIK